MSNTQRPFGMEFECYHPTKTRGVSRVPVKAFIESLGHKAKITDYHLEMDIHSWMLKYDGSLENGVSAGKGWELVTPKLAPTAANFAIVNQVLDFMLAQGFKVNKSCGYHVHLDTADLTSQEMHAVTLRYDHFFAAFCAVLPASRHNAYYATRLRDHNNSNASLNKVTRAVRDPGANVTWSHGERYQPVNMEHAHKGTGSRRLEFRQHSGTVEFPKAFGWYSLICDFIAETVKIVRDHSGVAAVQPAAPSVVAPLMRRQRRRTAVQTVSRVVAMAPARVPYIQPQSDYDRFLNAMLGNGVVTQQDARGFGWDDTRLRVTAHWLRRNGAVIRTTRRNGEVAYVPEFGVSTREALFSAPAQVRERLVIGSAQQVAQVRPVQGVQPSLPSGAALINKLQAVDFFEGFSEQTRVWYALRKAALANRP